MKKYSPYAGVFGLILIVAGLLVHYVRSVWQWQEIVPLALGGALLLFYLVFNFKAIIDFVTHRGALQTANAVLMCVLVLGLLGFANYLAGKHTWRKDTTAARQFSLSDQTKKVLMNLKEDLRVFAFYLPQEQDLISDQLKEFAAVTPKFKYEFIDPDKKPDMARRYGLAVKSTTVFSYRGQDEKITTATEEDMTNAIIKVTRDKKKKIYFTTNHGEKAIDNEERTGMSAAQKIIKDKNYEVGTISLIDTSGIPQDCSVLAIAGPQTPFLPAEIDKVKDYLNKGGAALFLLDPEPAPSLNEVLADYGVQANNDLIIDASGVGQLFGTEANVPVVTNYGKHAITEKFGSFMTAYPNTRSLTLMSEKPAGVTVDAFASTSPYSWGETNMEELRSRQVTPNEGDKRGPLAMGVAATKSAGSDGTASNGSNGSRVAIFGDSDFAANNFFAFQKNGDLFMNVISWLAEEEDLIAIPPKNPEDRRISLTAAGSKVIMLVSLFLLPLAAFGTAIAVYMKRR